MMAIDAYAASFLANLTAFPVSISFLPSSTISCVGLDLFGHAVKALRWDTSVAATLIYAQQVRFS